jgi:uncharacterized protein with FMN-binding domain
MAKNKIQDLRDHLFETIELLKDKESDMTIEKAKAIADVSQVIINSAKLEVDFIRATDKLDGFYPSTGFIEIERKKLTQ